MSNLSVESNQFRIYTAQKFLEGLSNQTSENNLYTWIGKSTPWTNDSIPPRPDDTVASRISSFADMMAIKRVSPSDVSLVIPRYDWTASTVYAQYTDLGAFASGSSCSGSFASGYFDLYEPTTNSAPFYVLTSDNNVYKCLNNAYGSASSIMPTGTGTVPITLSDGYTWKFMFQVSSEDVQKFLSPDWIPLHSLTFNDGSAQWAVQATAVKGAIYNINVLTGGSYGSTPTITIIGDGDSCTATANLTGTAVTSITITNPGKGYTHATVQFNSGSATAHAIISPPGGHGSDPLTELGAMYAMVDVLLNYDESDKITTDNDYRKFGLLLNPLFFNSAYYYYPLIGTLTTNLTLSSVTGSFNPDDLVTGASSGITGRIVDYNLAGSNILRLDEVIRNTASGSANGFILNETLNDNTSSAIAEVTAIANPDIQPNTGLILTTEYTTPITRAPAQIEDIKITLPF